MPVGSDTITAVYGGDSNYTASTSNPLTETVGKNNTTGTISSSSTTPAAGQSVTLTITQPSVYGVVPTGTENFYSNGTLIGTAMLNSSGIATLTTSDLPSGTDQITGLYSGDNNYQSTAPRDRLQGRGQRDADLLQRGTELRSVDHADRHAPLDQRPSTDRNGDVL